MGSKKAVMGALRPYLDFINLFMMLMRLLGTAATDSFRPEPPSIGRASRPADFYARRAGTA